MRTAGSDFCLRYTFEWIIHKKLFYYDCEGRPSETVSNLGCFLKGIPVHTHLDIGAWYIKQHTSRKPESKAQVGLWWGP